MGLTLEQKQTVVAEVAKQVAGAQAIVLAENRGMAVAAMTQLRAKARASASTRPRWRKRRRPDETTNRIEGAPRGTSGGEPSKTAGAKA